MKLLLSLAVINIAVVLFKAALSASSSRRQSGDGEERPSRTKEQPQYRAEGEPTSVLELRSHSLRPRAPESYKHILGRALPQLFELRSSGVYYWSNSMFCTYLSVYTSFTPSSPSKTNPIKTAWGSFPVANMAQKSYVPW